MGGALKWPMRREPRLRRAKETKENGRAERRRHQRRPPNTDKHGNQIDGGAPIESNHASDHCCRWRLRLAAAGSRAGRKNNPRLWRRRVWAAAVAAAADDRQRLISLRPTTTTTMTTLATTKVSGLQRSCCGRRRQGNDDDICRRGWRRPTAALVIAGLSPPALINGVRGRSDASANDQTPARSDLYRSARFRRSPVDGWARQMRAPRERRNSLRREQRVTMRRAALDSERAPREVFRCRRRRKKVAAISGGSQLELREFEATQSRPKASGITKVAAPKLTPLASARACCVRARLGLAESSPAWRDIQMLTSRTEALGSERERANPPPASSGPTSRSSFLFVGRCGDSHSSARSRIHLKVARLKSSGSARLGSSV